MTVMDVPVWAEESEFLNELESDTSYMRFLKSSRKLDTLHRMDNDVYYMFEFLFPKNFLLDFGWERFRSHRIDDFSVVGDMVRVRVVVSEYNYGTDYAMAVLSFKVGHVNDAVVESDGSGFVKTFLYDLETDGLDESMNLVVDQDGLAFISDGWVYVLIVHED